MNKNMDFLKLVEERYSVRKFTEKAVEQDTIDKILKRILSHSLDILN